MKQKRNANCLTQEADRLKLMEDNRDANLLKGQYEILKLRYNTLLRDFKILEKANLDLECKNNQLASESESRRHAYETWYERFEEVWHILWDLFRSAPDSKQKQIMEKYGDEWRWYH